MQILYELNAQGHTIIMVTHDPNLAAQAERVIELKDGYVIADYKNERYQQTEVKPEPISDKHRKNAFSSFIDRIFEAFKMSLLAMRAHKMRTLLTMLGIIIGIASVVSVVGLGKGSQAQILSNISSLGTNTITVSDGYPYGDPETAIQ